MNPVWLAFAAGLIVGVIGILGTIDIMVDATHQVGQWRRDRRRRRAELAVAVQLPGARVVLDGRRSR